MIEHSIQKLMLLNETIIYLFIVALISLYFFQTQDILAQRMHVCVRAYMYVLVAFFRCS